MALSPSFTKCKEHHTLVCVHAGEGFFPYFLKPFFIFFVFLQILDPTYKLNFLFFDS